MMVVPAGVKVHLALGHTDMRKGLDGLATLIQEHLKKDPFSGHLFVFRGKNASLLKILFWDGTGLFCSPSAWITDSSCGRAWLSLAARWHCRRHNSRCSSRASTGVRRNASGDQCWRAETGASVVARKPGILGFLCCL
jgi:hypothetical protein